MKDKADEDGASAHRPVGHRTPSSNQHRQPAPQNRHVKRKNTKLTLSFGFFRLEK